MAATDQTLRAWRRPPWQRELRPRGCEDHQGARHGTEPVRRLSAPARQWQAGLRPRPSSGRRAQHDARLRRIGSRRTWIERLDTRVLRRRREVTSLPILLDRTATTSNPSVERTFRRLLVGFGPPLMSIVRPRTRTSVVPKLWRIPPNIEQSLGLKKG